MRAAGGVELNALALEYQADYGSARGDLDILDLVNNPAASDKCRVLGLGFQEQWSDLFRGEVRPTTENGLQGC